MKTSWVKLGYLFPAVLLVAFFTGCDPLRKGKCEWYLVPEPEHRNLVNEGWVSICARNFVNNRQKCYLQLVMAEAKAIYGKKVVYSDLKIDKGEFPHKVSRPAACEP